MKKYSIFFLIYLLSIFGCAKNNEPLELRNDGFSLILSAPDYIKVNKTKSYLSTDGKFEWTKGDRIGIFSHQIQDICQTASQLAMTVESGQGTTAAYSNTTGWILNNEEEYKYVSYYPFDSENTRDKISISYAGQIQSKNNSSEGLYAFDYMYSNPVIPITKNHASFEFNHIGAMVNIRISIPEEYKACKFYRMRLFSDEQIFTESASYSIGSIISNTEPSFTKNQSYYLNLDFNSDGISSSDGTISVWLMMFPSKLSGKSITVKLYGSLNMVPTLEGNLSAQEDQKPGCLYSYTVTSTATGALLPDKPIPGEQLHVLLLGHSFGGNCFAYLPQITVAAGVKDVHYGRFYQSNCRLDQYWDHVVAGDLMNYTNYPAGKTSGESRNRSIDDVLTSYPWDIVIFQQATYLVQDYTTYQPYLDNLVAHVKQLLLMTYRKEPVIGWNMYWSWNPDGSYKAPVTDNTLGLYNSILSATQTMMTDTGIDLIIPVGTAVQNARTTSLNTPTAQVFTDDGLHASVGIGQYVSGCAWYQKLIAPIFGVEVTANTYRPASTAKSFNGDEITDATAAILQKCAVEAVKHPFEVTQIKE